LRVIDLKDSAQKQATPENAICFLSPDKSEAVFFEPQELEDLIAELSSGRIALDYLAEHLKLSCHQLHYVVEYLLKTGRVNGELTYSTFTSSGTSKLLHLQKAAAHKREHRRQMMEKNRKH
jgi:hypothetical protein